MSPFPLPIFYPFPDELPSALGTLVSQDDHPDDLPGAEPGPLSPIGEYDQCYRERHRR